MEFISAKLWLFGGLEDRGRSSATERITLAPPPQLEELGSAPGVQPPGSAGFSLEGGRSSISKPGESGDALSLSPSSSFIMLPSCSNFGDVIQSLLLLLLVNVLLLSILLLWG